MHASTIYRLYNDTESYIFMSEKDACDFIGSKRGHVSNCYCSGCKAKGYSIEKIGPSTHMLSKKTRLYGIWDNMKRRCYSEKHIFYKNYGGRGIKMCDEWLGNCGFIKFYHWAKNHGYSEGLSIDRIDNNGNYEPSNCRWVTQLEQGANNSQVRLVFVNGEYLSPHQIEIKYGIKRDTVRKRIRRGMDPITGERKKED